MKVLPQPLKCKWCAAAPSFEVEANDCVVTPEDFGILPLQPGDLLCECCRIKAERAWIKQTPKDTLLMGVGYPWYAEYLATRFKERLDPTATGWGSGWRFKTP